MGTATATTTKKQKYTVIAAILSGAGLTAFTVAQYASSSGRRGDNGGGGRGGGHGIRASVDTVDGLLLLSSVDLRSGWSGDNTCIPATGTRVGKSFQEGDTPFETCYKNEHTEEECWSKSYFNGCFWTECLPKDKGWHFLNSGAASSTCGFPCQRIEKRVSEAE